MPTVTTKWFTRSLANVFGGETAPESISIDWISDTIKVALLSVVPDQDTVQFWGDISGTQVTGPGWGAPVELTGRTVSVDEATNTVSLDADDVSEPWVTVSGVAAVAIFKDTGVAATSPVLGFGSLDTPGASSGGTLTITWDAGGILTITAS